MTDHEHARAIAAAHEALMVAVRAAWDDHLNVEADLTPHYCGPWSLHLRVLRTRLLAEGNSISQRASRWVFTEAQEATP